MWEISVKWLQQHLNEILEDVEIDWSDSFEYGNLCAAYCHEPQILEALIAHGKEKSSGEEAREWEKLLPKGSNGYYQKTMSEWERIKKDYFPNLFETV